MKDVFHCLREAVRVHDELVEVDAVPVLGDPGQLRVDVLHQDLQAVGVGGAAAGTGNLGKEN